MNRSPDPRGAGRPAGALLLTATVIAVAFALAAPAAHATAPGIADLIARVSQGRLTEHVQRLQDFRTRHSSTDSVAAAADWLIAEEAGFGYTDVQTESFTSSGRTQRNIIVTKPGVSRPEDIYIIGGHYDTTSSDITRAPGADDDGSGTAAVLMMAEILADVPLDATVMFAHWAAEEQGKIGSQAFVNHAFDQGWGNRIRLYMNLDACGYQGDPDDVVKFMTDPVTSSYNDQLRLLCSQYTTLVPATLSYISYSDHASFHARNIPFTYTIEEDVTPYIHSPQDLIATMDFAYFQKIVQTNLAGLATFAGLTTTGVAGPAVAVSPAPGTAPTLRLAGANPTPGPVELELDAPEATIARVTIHDLSGRRVATLMDGAGGPGTTRLRWDGRDAHGARMPAGVYVARLDAAGHRDRGGATAAGRAVKIVLVPWPHR